MPQLKIHDQVEIVAVRQSRTEVIVRKSIIRNPRLSSSEQSEKCNNDIDCHEVTIMYEEHVRTRSFHFHFSNFVLPLFIRFLLLISDTCISKRFKKGYNAQQSRTHHAKTSAKLGFRFLQICLLTTYPYLLIEQYELHEQNHRIYQAPGYKHRPNLVLLSKDKIYLRSKRDTQQFHSKVRVFAPGDMLEVQVTKLDI